MARDAVTSQKPGATPFRTAMTVEPEISPIETNLQNVCEAIAEIMAIGQRLGDPASELMITDTCCRILKNYRTDRAVEVVLMGRIRAGYRTISQLESTTDLTRRRIQRILDRMKRLRWVKSDKVPAAGARGGRPILTYSLTTAGDNYYFDARKNYSS